ncbi:N-formylglutamate amidohydrolase [Novosphingobium sp. 9U]|uniref:N-formylglutamate amidohydrolase n=1 Tax=Novosphingobium sp. 9U TaxID=2653158 RepID=UPI0019154069|nr:N-formylglutamate amidohydrolase [Novosphingobium sp. 9U]
MGEDAAEHESHEPLGGRIPGSPGVAAFRVWGDEPSSLPIVLSVPHAGRAYPRALLRDMRHPESSALKLEDRYVDRLGRAIAQETGAALLVAQAPRAMIDLNRAPEDVDWEMFGRSARSEPRPDPANRRARTGLGLIPRRLPGIGELWRRRHEEVELAERIAQIHAPYHARLGAMLKTHQERWGAVLLVDLHSMPPLVARAGQPAAEFVIGDRFGTTCHGSLVGAAFSHLAQAGRPAAHNRPYAGGYVLERHANVRCGIHAMQVEVDRSAYLDSRLAEPGAGFDEVAQLLTGMIRRLAQSVLDLATASGGESWPLAAE